MLVDMSVRTWIEKARLPCWPLYSQQVSHQRWIWGSQKQKKHTRDPPWVWNPGQMSPEVQNRGIRGPTKRSYVLKIFFKKLKKKKKKKAYHCNHYSVVLLYLFFNHKSQYEILSHLILLRTEFVRHISENLLRSNINTYFFHLRLSVITPSIVLSSSYQHTLRILIRFVVL